MNFVILLNLFSLEDFTKKAVNLFQFSSGAVSPSVRLQINAYEGI